MLDSFRLHTDSLYNVIKTIDTGSLDVWIGMVDNKCFGMIIRADDWDRITKTGFRQLQQSTLRSSK